MKPSYREHVEGSGGRRLWLAAAALTPVGILIGLLLSDRWRSAWTSDLWAKPVLVVHLLAVAACCWGGLLLLRRRPANREGKIAVLLGLDLGLFYVVFFHTTQEGWWPLAIAVILLCLRPLLLWLVLAWPTGRLDRTGRWLVLGYAAATTALAIVDTGMRSDADGWRNDPIGFWDHSAFTQLVSSTVTDLGTLAAGVLLLVVAWRRHLRFRNPSDGWRAAVIAAVGDLVLAAQGPMRDLGFHDDHLTPFGTTVQVIDIGRWGLVVVILVVSARVAWKATGAGAGAVPEPSSLDEVVSAALGDPNATVVFAAEGGAWIDGAGRDVPAPVAGDGRVTVIAREGTPVAAILHDQPLAAHPSALEAGAAAIAATLDARVQQALAERRTRELEELGREVVAAEERARQQLERDLHDGAQQTIVGLAVHAGLAARTLQRDPGRRAERARELAAMVDEAHAELLALATGRPPALLAERGLAGALGALATTAGVPVVLQLDGCRGLPEGLERGVWFVAAEAVTNALKHARAGELRVTVRRSDDGGALELTVADDGVGGVSAPPRSLAQRVEEAGGLVVVEGGGGGVGTAVRVSFPLSERVPA